MKNMKLWDWVVWNQRLKTKIKWKTVKIIEHFMSSKKLFFSCVCIKWTHLLYSLQTHGEKTTLKLKNMVVKYG